MKVSKTPMFRGVKRFLIFIHWMLLIAVASIGIEAYNRHPEYKQANKGAFDFLWWMIAFGVVSGIYHIGLIVMFTGNV